MLKFIKSKKGLALLATVVAVLAGTVGAYAYWTSTGTGAGSATAGSAADSVNITLNVKYDPGLVPGGVAKTVTFKAKNSGATDGIVHTISFHSVTDPIDTSGGGCTTYLNTYGLPGQDFSMPTLTETAPGTIVPGTGTTTALGTQTLTWANNPTQDQTPCAGQNLQLNVDWS